MSIYKRIIPCLDVNNGRVVKGINFVNITDAGDPVEIAKRYDSEGADEITFLDITATHEARKTLLQTVESVASQVFIPLTVGGGVTSFTDVQDLLNAGADKVAINSAAVNNPDLINEVTSKTGRQCIVVAMDVKKVSNNRWNVFTHGGRKDSGRDALEWAKDITTRGAGEILLTSMDKDGTQSGFDLDLLNTISSNVSIPVIASGGAGTLDHLEEAITKGKADAVLAASIFHYSKYSIVQAKQYLKKKGVLVRS
ncbi:MAG: imidazole glycerol phosphate synthase subunit HisF [Gammaproteobacteria bacterium]|mgnify:CR=1 FL=1|nr:imidazole glycerol phosphate synthase subunit HisF [Gammaproteobacteria bacterium]